MPSYKVFGFNEETKDHGLQAGLDLLDEFRDDAQVKIMDHQRRMTKFYNLRFR